jgi:hypothetical protein
MACETKQKLATAYSEASVALAKAIGILSSTALSWGDIAEPLRAEKAAKARVDVTREALLRHLEIHGC